MPMVRSACGQCGARWLCMPSSLAIPLITGADPHTQAMAMSGIAIGSRHSRSQSPKAMARSKDTRLLITTLSDSLTFSYKYYTQSLLEFITRVTQTFSRRVLRPKLLLFLDAISWHHSIRSVLSLRDIVLT